MKVHGVVNSGCKPFEFVVVAFDALYIAGIVEVESDLAGFEKNRSAFYFTFVKHLLFPLAFVFAEDQVSARFAGVLLIFMCK